MEVESKSVLIDGPEYKKREEARRFKVITNGVKTEAGYFVRLDKISIDNIEVETGRGKQFSLDGMLELAKKIILKSDGNYDEVCIVLDIDGQMDNKKEREKLKRFLEEAEKAGVPVYLSNESFEVWLLAHKITVSKKVSQRGIATSLAVEEGLLDGERSKWVVDEEITANSVKRALVEAMRLRRTYGDNILKDKPTTEVDLFVKKVRLDDDRF